MDKVHHLIDLFKERACLWDIFSQVCQNREKKQVVYNEIRDELDTSVEEIKAKIMNLSSQLGRELGKIKERNSYQSTSDLYKPTWTHSVKLQFLSPVMNQGKSKDASSTSNEVMEDAKCVETENSLLASNPRLTQLTANKALMEQEQELVAKCLDVLRKPDESEEKPCHLFSFIYEKLCQMDRRTRAIAGKRIYDVIFDLEMNGLYFSSENEG